MITHDNLPDRGDAERERNYSASVFSFSFFVIFNLLFRLVVILSLNFDFFLIRVIKIIN